MPQATLLTLLNHFYKYLKKPYCEVVVSLNCNLSALGIQIVIGESDCLCGPGPNYTSLSTPSADAFMLPWENLANTGILGYLSLFYVKGHDHVEECGERGRRPRGSPSISIPAVFVCPLPQTATIPRGTNSWLPIGSQKSEEFFYSLLILGSLFSSHLWSFSMVDFERELASSQ